MLAGPVGVPTLASSFASRLRGRVVGLVLVGPQALGLTHDAQALHGQEPASTSVSGRIHAASVISPLKLS